MAGRAVLAGVSVREPVENQSFSHTFHVPKKEGRDHS